MADAHQIRSVGVPFTVKGHGQILLTAMSFVVGALAGLIVRDQTSIGLPAFIFGAILAAGAFVVLRECDSTAYGDDHVVCRQIVKRTRIEVSDLRELVLVGGPNGKVVVGYTTTGRRVHIGPAGGKVHPAEVGPFVHAVAEWAAVRSVTVTDKLAWWS
jgi:hypothetical protein